MPLYERIMSSAEGITVEQLMEKLQEMIDKKPIVKKMNICFAVGTTLQPLADVKTERERDGQSVRPFVLMR